jgi:hypothetical protein
MKKKCIECGFTKDIDEFWKDTAKPDGHMSKCNNCCRTRRRAAYSKKSTGEGYASSVIASLMHSDDSKGVHGDDY